MDFLHHHHGCLHIGVYRMPAAEPLVMPACPLAIQQALDLIFNQGALSLEHIHIHTRQRGLAGYYQRGYLCRRNNARRAAGIACLRKRATASSPRHRARREGARAQPGAFQTLSAVPCFRGSLSSLVSHTACRCVLQSFGIYTDRAGKTCGGRTASFGHELQDAKTYAAWGVD